MEQAPRKINHMAKKGTTLPYKRKPERRIHPNEVLHNNHRTQSEQQEKQQHKCAWRKGRQRHKKYEWKKKQGRILSGIHRFQKHLNH
jgi:hypothetical protein